MKFFKEAEPTLGRCQNYFEVLMQNGLIDADENELEGIDRIVALEEQMIRVSLQNPQLFVEFAKIVYKPTIWFPLFAIYAYLRNALTYIMYKCTRSSFYKPICKDMDIIYSLLKSSEVASSLMRFRERTSDAYHTNELWCEAKGRIKVKEDKAKKDIKTHYLQISYLPLAELVESKGMAYKSFLGIKIPIPPMDVTLALALEIASIEEDRNAKIYNK